MSIACNANGNCNGNGYDKCCHIASQYPFSPCLCVCECVWLLFLLHIFTMAFTFFSPSVVVVVVVCVFMFYTSNCCLMCCSPPPTKTSSSRVAQPWGRGNGEWGFWHAEVKFASFFKRLRINFSTIHSTSTNAKKLLPSSCSHSLPLYAFLFLLPPPRGFWINL